MSNKLELNINGIKNMDFDLFIESNPTIKIFPRNCNKIFTKKLNEIIALLKSKGDTHFKIKNVTSKCDCKDCKGKNADKHIHAFIGNISNDYFMLAIGINKKNNPIYLRMPCDSEYYIDDDNNGAVKFDETTPRQKYGVCHTFSIAGDEMDDFFADNNYLDLISHQNKAFEKLALKNNTINAYDELTEWLMEFEIGTDFLGFNYRILEEFNLLYAELDFFYNTCHYIDIAKDAMLEYKDVEITNDDYLMKWLIKYEEFHEEQLGLMALKVFGVDGAYLNFNIIKEYKIALSIFKELFHFIKVYENHHSLLLFWEKYRDENKTTDIKVKYCLDQKYFSLREQK